MSALGGGVWLVNLEHVVHPRGNVYQEAVAVGKLIVYVRHQGGIYSVLLQIILRWNKRPTPPGMVVKMLNIIPTSWWYFWPRSTVNSVVIRPEWHRASDVVQPKTSPFSTRHIILVN